MGLLFSAFSFSRKGSLLGAARLARSMGKPWAIIAVRLTSFARIGITKKTLWKVGNERRS